MSSNVQYQYQSWASQMWHSYDKEPGTILGWVKWLSSRALTCIAWISIYGTIALGYSEIATWLRNRSITQISHSSKDSSPDAAPPLKAEEYPDVTIALSPEECPDAVLSDAFRCQQLEREILKMQKDIGQLQSRAYRTY